MKKTLTIWLLGLVLTAGGCGLMPVKEKTAAKGPVVVLNTQNGKTEIAVDIVDTMETRTRGLMFRESMPEDEGMFFVFEEEDEKSFWMKNTLIPLDMIFIGADYRVVSITKGAVPCKADPCGSYPSKGPAKYVLEVNAGVSDKAGLKEGDKTELII